MLDNNYGIFLQEIKCILIKKIRAVKHQNEISV